jgi:hypothetical protein
MSLTDVLEYFAVDFTVTRPAPVERVRGRVVESGAPSTFSGRGSFQPATPEDLKRLPEGRRTDTTVAIFTDCVLNVGDPPSVKPDLVVPCGSVYNGIQFEIQSNEDWPVHRKYIAIKTGQ